MVFIAVVFVIDIICLFVFSVGRHRAVHNHQAAIRIH